MEQNRYKEIRGLLRQFNIIEAKKNDLEYDLKLLRDDVGINAINYDRVGKSYGISNTTQKQALDIVEIREEIALLIEKKSIELKKIENILKILNPIEKKIIELRYFENYDWANTSKLVDRSTSHCKSLEHKAIGKIDEFLN